ncbi:MAG: radical SAM family heme chaperone HemW, partial [Deltaproteobacteria bacterium]|nr:radical SAM family heme chaperone HemW [Deltaproteobacteria bacterium]
MDFNGLYIHVPFCRSKCPYCGFYSIASRSLIPDWLDALKEEAVRRTGRFCKFDTVYLGGGTPSILDSHALHSLMDRVRSCFSLAAGSEISIEANPRDVTTEKALELKSLGFNRITLGVQSFDDRVLSFLGRRHTADAAKAALTVLRDAGFENVGIDLIYGIAGQSLDGWHATLDQALAFSPEHLSCYELTIEEGTVFRQREKKGEMSPVDEKAARALFMTTSRFLEAKGYVHYEISNFARDERYRSRHNMKYWRHVPYLGLGPSAHSFDGGARWWNVRSVRQYGRMLAAGQLPVGGMETLTREQVDLERISLGLRMKEGFDLR